MRRTSRTTHLHPSSHLFSVLVCPSRWNQESSTTTQEAGSEPWSLLIGWEALWNTDDGGQCSVWRLLFLFQRTEADWSHLTWAPGETCAHFHTDRTFVVKEETYFPHITGLFDSPSCIYQILRGTWTSEPLFITILRIWISFIVCEHTQGMWLWFWVVTQNNLQKDGNRHTVKNQDKKLKKDGKNKQNYNVHNI